MMSWATLSNLCSDTSREARSHPTGRRLERNGYSAKSTKTYVSRQYIEKGYESYGHVAVRASRASVRRILRWDDP